MALGFIVLSKSASPKRVCLSITDEVQIISVAPGNKLQYQSPSVSEKKKRRRGKHSLKSVASIVGTSTNFESDLDSSVISNAVTSPISNAVIPPVSNGITPPVSIGVTPPVSNGVTPPVSNGVTSPIPKEVTLPAPKEVTPPASKDETLCVPDNVTIPVSIDVTPSKDKTVPVPHDVALSVSNDVTLSVSSGISKVEIKNLNVEKFETAKNQSSKHEALIARVLSDMDKSQKKPSGISTGDVCSYAANNIEISIANHMAKNSEFSTFTKSTTKNESSILRSIINGNSKSNMFSSIVKSNDTINTSATTRVKDPCSNSKLLKDKSLNDTGKETESNKSACIVKDVESCITNCTVTNIESNISNVLPVVNSNLSNNISSETQVNKSINLKIASSNVVNTTTNASVNLKVLEPAKVSRSTEKISTDISVAGVKSKLLKSATFNRTAEKLSMDVGVANVSGNSVKSRTETTPTNITNQQLNQIICVAVARHNEQQLLCQNKCIQNKCSTEKLDYVNSAITSKVNDAILGDPLVVATSEPKAVMLTLFNDTRVNSAGASDDQNRSIITTITDNTAAAESSAAMEKVSCLHAKSVGGGMNKLTEMVPNNLPPPDCSKNTSQNVSESTCITPTKLLSSDNCKSSSASEDKSGNVSKDGKKTTCVPSANVFDNIQKMIGNIDGGKPLISNLFQDKQQSVKGGTKRRISTAPQRRSNSVIPRLCLILPKPTDNQLALKTTMAGKSLSLGKRVTVSRLIADAAVSVENHSVPNSAVTQIHQAVIPVSSSKGTTVLMASNPAQAPLRIPAARIKPLVSGDVAELPQTTASTTIASTESCRTVAQTQTSPELSRKRKIKQIGQATDILSLNNECEDKINKKLIKRAKREALLQQTVSDQPVAPPASVSFNMSSSPSSISGLSSADLLSQANHAAMMTSALQAAYNSLPFYPANLRPSSISDAQAAQLAFSIYAMAANLGLQSTAAAVQQMAQQNCNVSGITQATTCSPNQNTVSMSPPPSSNSTTDSVPLHGDQIASTLPQPPALSETDAPTDVDKINFDGINSTQITQHCTLTENSQLNTSSPVTVACLPHINGLANENPHQSSLNANNSLQSPHQQSKAGDDQQSIVVPYVIGESVPYAISDNIVDYSAAIFGPNDYVLCLKKERNNDSENKNKSCSAKQTSIVLPVFDEDNCHGDGYNSPIDMTTKSRIKN